VLGGGTLGVGVVVGGVVVLGGMVGGAVVLGTTFAGGVVVLGGMVGGAVVLGTTVAGGVVVLGGMVGGVVVLGTTVAGGVVVFGGTAVPGGGAVGPASRRSDGAIASLRIAIRGFSCGFARAGSGGAASGKRRTVGRKTLMVLG
jgi:hypothetical protein